MQTPPQSKNHSKRFLWYGIFLLAALLAWFAWTTFLRSQNEVDLPYSAFIEQVNDSNVRAVTITGSQIDGVLVRPVTGPVPVTGRPENVGGSLVFRTQFPDSVGDPNLVALLNSHHVLITAPAARSSGLSVIQQAVSAIPLLGLAFLVLVAGIIAGSGGLLHGLKRLNPFHHESPLTFTIEHPTESYGSIAGQDKAVETLRAITQSGALPPILMITGKAGTGKTLLARAIAGETGAALLTCRAANLLPQAIKAQHLHNLFALARSSAPCVLLIDGLDDASRDNPTVFSQLLAELDGIEPNHGLMVIGETRRPDHVEPALLRSGRFSQAIFLEVPDRQAREDILGLHTRGLNLANNVNLGVIARTTTGFSGMDLDGLCAAAARIAQRDSRDSLTMADFEDALDHLLIQSQNGLLLNEQERRAIAYHEAGHALASWLLPAAVPMNRISILPRNDSIGDAQPLPGEEDRGVENAWQGSGKRNPNLFSKEDILARLSVMLSGRAAEEIAIGDVTINAEDDLVEATRLARRMVTRWGMGSMGLMALNPPDPLRASRTEIEISEETAARIDQDVQKLLSSSYAAVRKLLDEARDPLDRLVKALLIDETLDQEEIGQILGPRPFEMPDAVHESNTTF